MPADMTSACRGGQGAAWPAIASFLWRTENRRYGLVLAVATLAAYAPVFQAGFVYDDVETLVKNRVLFQAPLGRLFFTHDYFRLTQEASYRPVNTLTFLVDHAVWGFRAFGWHLTNVALHLACVGCLWALLRQWELAAPAAFLGAAAFALHPVHVEAVASPGFREDLISALGMLGMALLLGRWQRAHRRGAAILVSASAVTFLAQMAKENALMAPGLAAALAWADPWPGGHGERAGFRRMAPFLGAVGLATVVSACIRFGLMVDVHQPPPARLASSYGQILANVPWIYGQHGLAPVFWPVRLRPDRVVNLAETPLLKVLGGWALAGFLGCAVFCLGRFWRRGSAGLLWHGLAWAPTLNLVPIFIPAAERYAYLPDAGLAMILAMSASVVAKRIVELGPAGRGARRLATDASLLIAAAGLSVLGGLTFRQARTWKDPYTLWSRALALEPSSMSARGGLAYLDWMEGQKALAAGDKRRAMARLGHALRLLQEVLRANPRDKLALSNYASMLAEMGDYDRAEADLLRIVQEFPDDPNVNHNLGLLYALRQPADKEKALHYLRRAQELGFVGDEDQIRALQGEAEVPKIPPPTMDQSARGSPGRDSRDK